MEISWGGSSPSSIVAEFKDTCIDFSYNNTLTDSLAYKALIVEGNQAGVVFGDGNVPDTFSVVPGFGWEVMTANNLNVEEFTTAVITVCQMLLG